MKLLIDFLDETEELEQSIISEVESILNFAANMKEIDDGTELSVTFVDNERIQEINREYRDKDQPTDVISFALEELGVGETVIVGANQPRHLGDIIISTQKAIEQADEYGHSFMRELGFLAVHGFLHLLGYDHVNEEDEKVMFSLQTQILNEYGLTR
ncbi:rRNA maturation RNase YbeY [Bacillus salitolerans]|uniref:Endoribonuclease YbeY n=1 Tax=Bacillus salitolerans TaxID=1437434 RepID=A0ABW4LN51_9BACI